MTAVVDTIASIARALPPEPVLDLVALFGSTARGRTRPGSDLDIAVLASRALTVGEQASLAAALSTALRREVDLTDLRQASTILAYEVARHGALVRERAPGQWSRFRAQAASAYADFTEAVAPHLETYRRRIASGG